MVGSVMFLIAIIGVTVLVTVLSIMYVNKKKVQGDGQSAKMVLSTTHIVLISLVAVVVMVLALLFYFYSTL